MTTKYSRQCERQIRVEVFLPQDCIDFYLENPKEGINWNVKKHLLKYWFENRPARKAIEVGDYENPITAPNSRQ